MQRHPSFSASTLGKPLLALLACFRAHDFGERRWCRAITQDTMKTKWRDEGRGEVSLQNIWVLSSKIYCVLYLHCFSEVWWFLECICDLTVHWSSSCCHHSHTWPPRHSRRVCTKDFLLPGTSYSPYWDHPEKSLCKTIIAELSLRSQEMTGEKGSETAGWGKLGEPLSLARLPRMLSMQMCIGGGLLAGNCMLTIWVSAKQAQTGAQCRSASSVWAEDWWWLRDPQQECQACW